MTVSISGTTPGIAVDGTGAVVNVTVTTGVGGGGGGVALGETSTTAYRGDRGKTAYDHSQVTTGNPHGTTAADVGADPAGTAAGLVDDLSGVSDQATARTNLGLGTAAVTDTGTGSSNTILGNDARLSDARTPTSHVHGASEVTSGTLDIARIPTGTTSTTAALGDHNHSGVYQPADSDLTTLAGLTATTDSFIQAKAGAWAARTIAQVKADLGVAPLYPPPSGTTVQNYGRSADGTIAIMGATGRMQLTPIHVAAGTWDAVGVRTTSAAAATWRLGYYPIASTGLPDWANVYDAGTVNMNSSTGWQWATFSRTITEGWYYIAYLCDAYTANPTVSITNERPFVSPTLPMDAAANTGTAVALTYTGVTTGALPTTTQTPLSYGSDSVTCAIVRMRRA